MQALVRVRAPYAPALVAVGRGRARTGGCGCIGEDSADVFEALGMPHAAEMHGLGEGRGEWPVDDWKLHLDEEEEPGKFFDALDAVAATLPVEERTAVESEVDALRRDHVTVREGLARGEVPSREVALAHGAREDKLAKRYKRRLLEYARDRAARTGVGAFDFSMPSSSTFDAPLSAEERDKRMVKLAPDYAAPAEDKPPYLLIVGSTVAAVAAVLAWRYWL